MELTVDTSYRPLPLDPPRGPRPDEPEHALPCTRDTYSPASSMVPAGLALAQTVATTGAIVAGFSLSARSTHEGDPMHYRAWGVGSATAAVVAQAMQLGVTLHRGSLPIVQPTITTLYATALAAHGAMLVQKVLDGDAPDRLGGLGVALLTGSIACELGVVAAQLARDQADWGNIPMPSWLPGGWRDALTLAGVSAAMAGLGTTLGLRARAAHDEAARIGWLIVAGAASVPLMIAMASCTRNRR